MPRKPKNLEQLKQLSEHLQLWRAQWSITDDPYVEGLINALNTGSDLHIWLSHEPQTYLPTNYSYKNFKSSIAQRIIIVRNVLIFAPVAFTWFSLSQATTGFARYNATVGNQLVNFLAFWQQPSSYLPSMWTITHTAILDGIIISGIGLITLLSDLMQNRAKRERALTLAAFERSRKELLLKINEIAQPHLLANPEIAVKTLSTTIKSLQFVSAKLEKDFTQFQKSAILISTPATNKAALSKFLSGVLKKFDQA